MLNPFTPATTVSRTVSASTARVSLPLVQHNQIMVTGGSAISFIKFGDVTVEAALTDIPILPSIKYVFSISPSSTHVAAIGTAGTVYFTVGNGQ